MRPRHPELTGPAHQPETPHPIREKIADLAADVDRMCTRIAQCWDDADAVAAHMEHQFTTQSGRSMIH
jgi:hypothetical protein